MRTVKIKVLEADTEEMAKTLDKVFQTEVTFMLVEASLVTAFRVEDRGAIFNEITIKTTDMPNGVLIHLLNEVFDIFTKESHELKIS